MSETTYHNGRVSGVGSYGNAPSVPREETEFDTQARARLNGQQVFDDSSPRFEDWSPEKQRAGYEGALRADEKRIANTQSGNEFAQLHVEYLDTDENGDRMVRMLRHLFGNVPYTLSMFESAYQALLITDSLDIDKAEVAKQQQQATNAQRKAVGKQRQERERLRNLSEEEMNTLPLDEVRNHANRQLQEDMQRAGERGGNGF